MIRLLTVLVMAFLLYSCNDDAVSTDTQDYTAKFNLIQNFLDSSWSDYSQKNNIPDSCGIGCYITIKGAERFFKTINKNTLNEKNRYRIASNTKVFTAAAIMLLHQKGKININDTISHLMPGSTESYLPDHPDFNIPYKNKITIKQLLQHRAGIYDIANDLIPANVDQPYAGSSYFAYRIQNSGIDYQFTIDELIKVVSDCQIYYSEPGTDFHYSNTGFQVLAKIIERASGKSYVDFIVDEILIKNNLSSTSVPFISTDNLIPEPFVEGYYITTDGCFDVTKSNMSFNIAEGNIISSFFDMNKWIKLLLSGNAGISRENISLMEDYSDNPVDKFGLGVEYFEGIGYGHTGAHAGYSSKTIYNPENDLSITFLANFWNFSNNMTSFMEQYNYTQGLLKQFIKILNE